MIKYLITCICNNVLHDVFDEVIVARNLLREQTILAEKRSYDFPTVVLGNLVQVLVLLEGFLEVWLLRFYVRHLLKIIIRD